MLRVRKKVRRERIFLAIFTYFTAKNHRSGCGRAKKTQKNFKNRMWGTDFFTKLPPAVQAKIHLCIFNKYMCKVFYLYFLPYFVLITENANTSVFSVIT